MAWTSRLFRVAGFGTPAVLFLSPILRGQDTADNDRGGSVEMSLDENKALIRRYMQAIDDNQTSDWSILDDYLAEDFVAHNPQIPGTGLDRQAWKEAAEIFRTATPGVHEIKMQVAEGDLVVSYIAARGVHRGEILGIPATNKEVETEGIAIHRVRDGKIVEYWSVVDVARVLQQMGVLSSPEA
jgi:predicted ester cyclase